MMNSLVLHSQLRRKIKFETTPTEWAHHRGGWSYVLKQLRNQLYTPDGMLFISAVVEITKAKAIQEPWVGFIHQAPRNNYPDDPDLERVLKCKFFLESLQYCHGIFVLSDVVKQYLLEYIPIPIPIALVLNPITPFPDDLKFSWDKFEGEALQRVLFVGEFLRNFQAFYDLKVPAGYQKILLQAPTVNLKQLFNCNLEKIELKTNDSVAIVDHVPDEEYDKLLSSSIVFLNLYDATSNTIVLECLGRHTPLVINRLPGVEEYLGKDYPLFYDTLEEAAELLKSKGKLDEASQYLEAHSKKMQLTGENFVESFVSSAIYRCLPLPQSQKADPTQTRFPQFDLTVVICSYQRVYNMKLLLECLKKQDFTGRFELILWNNKHDTQTELAEICAPFMKSLNLRLIQSSENYYCIIRLAVSQLMQSDLMLICDDDVIPKPNYISTFMAKYKEYGPRAVLCCRGHLFKQHLMNVEKPHLFWEDYNNMEFFDESIADRQEDMMNSLVLHTQLRRKIKFETTPTEWTHHRGGWSYAMQQLRNQLYAPDGMLCVGAVEEIICNWEAIQEPWIGFVHQVPRNNYPEYPDLERLVRDKFFLESLKNCHGIFVLSNMVKQFLVEHISVPIARVLYPITPFPDDLKFSWDKCEGGALQRVLFVGEFLRNFQAFYDLKVPAGYKKVLLKAPDVDLDNLFDCNLKEIQLKPNDSVTIIDHVPNEEYDKLLSSSVIFLNLYDAPANTTVIECLGRHTPVVVNRLPGIEEYLGENYPLFYDTLEEAAELLKSRSGLAEASRYLEAHSRKMQLTKEEFVKSFTSSAIYRCLPLPPSQKADPTQTRFPQFDLTVVICSYQRVYNMKFLLECLEKQDFTGRFELILWNNKHDTQAKLAEICAPFMKSLNLRLIQSSENYYCIIRLAVSQLMQSDLMLICDDDVIPKPNYISTFMAKYKEYGPRAVLCCRGHLFKQHLMNVEKPHLFWEDYNNMEFFHESIADRQIHFIHADNCLIPRSLLLEVSSHLLPSPDFILIDDYWMSFVLSHHLKVPLWKIKGDEIFTSTECADDPSIALYHNPRVREQRVDFYCYHMAQGWPASMPLD